MVRRAICRAANCCPACATWPPRVSSRLRASSAFRSTTWMREGFRSLARAALEEFAARRIDGERWSGFARVPGLCAAVGRTGRAEGGGRARREGTSAPSAGGCTTSACRPTRRWPRCACWARPGWCQLTHHHGEALRHRPRQRGGAEQGAARGVRRGADLPHRPFPRQGAGAEHPGIPFRQRPVRADLEPQFHRPRADRRARDAGPRQARRASTSRPAPIATWWSRTCSRSWASSAMEAPTQPGAEADQRGEEQGVPQHAAHPARRRGARAVHRLSRRGGREPGIGHRDLHRPALLHRQLALGRRAFLSAHRQAHGRGPAHHFHRLPRTAEEHVPGRFRRRRARVPTT